MTGDVVIAAALPRPQHCHVMVPRRALPLVAAVWVVAVVVCLVLSTQTPCVGSGSARDNVDHGSILTSLLVRKDADDAVAIPGVSGMDREQLGRRMWGVLHTFAASYPPAIDDRGRAVSVENGTLYEDQDYRVAAKALLGWISSAYPCGMCRRHFRAMLAKYPVDSHLSNRNDLALWTCSRHNDVNVRLKKPLFDCKLAISAWTFKDCGCENDESSDSNIDVS